MGNSHDQDATVRSTDAATVLKAVLLLLKIQSVFGNYLAGDAGHQDKRPALRHRGGRLRVLAVAGHLCLHVQAADPGTERRGPLVRSQRGE